jgi:hypothetical protein
MSVGAVVEAGSFLPGVLGAGDDQQKAAPLGLFVLVLLGVACYFLFKSMSRHLKRVREDFPEPGPRPVIAADRTPADRIAADPAAVERRSTDLGSEPARPIPPIAP